MAKTVDEMYVDAQTAHAAGKTELAGRIMDSIREAKASGATQSPPATPAATNDVPPDRTLQDRIEQEQWKMAQDADPTKGMSWFEKLAAINTQQTREAGRGIWQFLNHYSGNLIGDKEKLAKEAAEAEKYDAPLKRGVFGTIAGAGTRAAMEAPIALATTAPRMAMLPVTIGSNLLRRVAPEAAERYVGNVSANQVARNAAAEESARLSAGTKVARSAAFGAGSGATTTSDKDYSPNMNAVFGALGGATGEAGGQVLGKAISPAMSAGNEIIRGQVERMQRAGMPLVLKNVTDSPFIKGLSDTMQQIGLGRGITRATDEQNRILTHRWTGATGVRPMGAVGAGTGVDVRAPSRQKYQDLRAIEGRVPIGGLQGELEAFLQNNAVADTMTGQGPGRMIPNVVRDLGDQRIGATLSDASRGPAIISTLDQQILENLNAVNTPANNTMRGAFGPGGAGPGAPSRTAANLLADASRQRPIVFSNGGVHVDPNADLHNLGEAVAPGRAGGGGGRGAAPGVQASVDQGGAAELGAAGVRGTIGDATAQTERAGVIPSLSRAQYLDTRLRLTRIARGSGVEADRAAEFKRRLDAEYQANVSPEEWNLLQSARAEHGISKDVVNAADPHKTIPLDARRLAAMAMDAEQRQAPGRSMPPYRDLHSLTMDVAARQGEPPKGFPRATMLALLAGAPLGGVGTSMFAEDSGPLPAIAGAAVPAAAYFTMATPTGRRYMMNQALSPLAKDMMARLLATGGASINR